MATGDSTSPGPGGAEEPLNVDEPFDVDGGRWRVTTQTSIYFLELDDRSVTRTPGAAEQGIDPQTGAAYPISVLRDDRRPQPIWMLLQCRVDEPMYLYTNAEPTGITLRGTTPVRQIRSLT